MWNAALILLAVVPALDLGPAARPRGDEIVLLEILDGESLVALRESVVSFGPGSYVWLGSLPGEPDSTVAIAHREGVVRGVLRSPRGELRISGAGPFGYVATPLAARAPSAEQRTSLAPASSGLGRFPTPDRGGPIDLLVVYTPRARALAGSTRDIEALVQLGVAEANLALEQSGARTRLRLVELREVNYTESGWIEGDLEILRERSDGALDDVHAARDELGADLVQLVVAEDDGCGISYLLPQTSPALESWAFSVVEWSCIDESLALAHEVGHSLGCDHAPDDPTSGGAFEFSFAYRDPVNRFRTIMAYGPGRRVARFSSARARLAELPTGTERQDNARTIDELRSAVARFRPAIEAPSVTLIPGTTIRGGAAELRVHASLGSGVEWWLVAGTSPGATDLFDSGLFDPGRPLRIAGLPRDGAPVFVRLFYRPGRVWLHEDFRFVTER